MVALMLRMRCVKTRTTATHHDKLKKMEHINHDIKVNSYITSMKTFAVALTLQFINWLTHLLGLITIADVTSVFAMMATGLAALNGMVLLFKNLRRKKDDPADKN